MNKDFYELNDTLEAEKAEILAEAYANEEAFMVETHPELFVERSQCCEAEVYDDAEFCVECYKRNPEIVYIRKEHLAGR